VVVLPDEVAADEVEPPVAAGLADDPAGPDEPDDPEAEPGDEPPQPAKASPAMASVSAGPAHRRA
jgi:hypothetical protein